MAACHRLIVFTRFPRPGTTKTRLIPALGREGAAALQRRLTGMTLAAVEPLRQDSGQDRGVVVEIRYAGGHRAAMLDWLGDRYLYGAQGRGDLGERLARAGRDAFRRGATKVVIIGTDCPALTAEVVSRAFLHLATADLVVGPALDGGYYLIGLNRPTPELFKDIPWGSSLVLRATLAQAGRLGLSAARLPILRDLDRPEDLEQLEKMNVEHRTSNVEF